MSKFEILCVTMHQKDFSKVKQMNIHSDVVFANQADRTDFAYMRKPLLYYQFDYEKFREGHYQEGYFSYKEDGFGEVCVNSEDLVKAFCDIVNNNMIMQPKYERRVDTFFAFYDKRNCERTYQAIIKRLEKRD